MDLKPIVMGARIVKENDMTYGEIRYVIQTPKSLVGFKEYNKARNAVPEWLVQVLYKLRVI